MSDERRDKIGALLSAVLLRCADLAAAAQFDLGRCAENNLEKLASRQDRGVISGSGDNR